MNTAHQTLKDGFTAFKTYAHVKTFMILYVVLNMPYFLTEIYMQPDDIMAKIIGIITSVISMILMYLIGMWSTLYVCEKKTFYNSHEFLNPPSSFWRVLLKVTALYILIIGIPMGIIAAMTYFMVNMGFVSKIAIGLIVMALSIYALICFIKLFLSVPYFTMNNKASIWSFFGFTDGYFAYISKILGWITLYGLLGLIVFAITMALVGLLANMLLINVDFISAVLAVVIQGGISILLAFVYAEAYKQIAENKP